MGCVNSRAARQRREQEAAQAASQQARKKVRSGSLTGEAMFQRELSTINEAMVQLHLNEDIRKVYDGLQTARRKKGALGDDGWLGTGNWGTVRVVTRRDDGRRFACKILRLSKHMSVHRRKELLDEILVLAKLDHPHIAKLYETYEEEGLNLFLVMELLEGGELFKRLTVDTPKGRFPEPVACNTTRQMVSAIAFLHSKGIVHRDLKLENFVYRHKGGEDLVLIDFGLSVRYKREDVGGSSSSISVHGSGRLGGSERDRARDGGSAHGTSHSHSPAQMQMHDVVGSSYYIAPEVLRKSYGIECDMWSLGVIVYMLLSGTPPFKGDTEQKIMASALTGVYSMSRPLWSTLSEEAKDFVRRCLIKDTARRLTAKEALDHPWLKMHRALPPLPPPQSPRGDGQPRSTRSGSLASSVSDGGDGSTGNGTGGGGTGHAISRGSVASMSSSSLASFAGGETRPVRDGIVQSLRQYSKHAHFKRIALQAVAYQLSHDEIRELEEAFKTMDVDGDGYITLEELSSALIHHHSLSASECQTIFDAIDFDGTGKIHFNEFIAAALDESYYHDETIIQHAFSRLDLDNDGLVDVEELRTRFGTGAPDVGVDDPEYVSEIVDKVLRDNEARGLKGKITVKEFMEIMRTSHESAIGKVPSIIEYDDILQEADGGDDTLTDSHGGGADTDLEDPDGDRQSTSDAATMDDAILALSSEPADGAGSDREAATRANGGGSGHDRPVRVPAAPPRAPGAASARTQQAEDDGDDRTEDGGGGGASEDDFGSENER